VAGSAFGLGFLLSYDEDTPAGTAVREEATIEVASASRPSTTTSLAAGPADAAASPMTTAAPSSVPPAPAEPPLVSEPEAPPAPPAPTQPPGTAAPPTTPTTVAAPGRLEVTYPKDGLGRMVLLEGGAAAVIVQNVGGSPARFDVSGVGSVTVGAAGSATGLLQAGEVRSVPLVAGAAPPSTPGPHATVSVYGVNGLVVAIPLVIA
jgi:hypothetical protein